ncbi:MAG: polysaccharide biosynthesis/export family protein [Alphaproteobacteria bacterium]
MSSAPVAALTPLAPLRRRRFAVGLVVGCASLSLGGCGTLPRAGPLASQIDPDEAPGVREGLVVTLDADVIARLEQPAVRGFADSLLAADAIDPTRLGVGDQMDVLVWEPNGSAIFGGGEGAGRLPAVEVASDGTIYVPFAGNIRAAGATPAELRARIRRALAPYTASPQVDLRLQRGVSRTVTIQGAVAQPGPYEIDRTSTRLLEMLAHAGGVTMEPERLEVAIRRAGATAAEMLEDIYAEPRLNVALRPGDLVLLTPLRQRFVVLGASGQQAQIPFPTREVSLLQAIAAAGGLEDFTADPKGVFVFRRERREQADALLAGPEPEGLPPGPGRPVVYRLDLTRPGALFVGERFPVRDGDAIFITNAPFTELRKILQVFTTVLVPVETTTRISQ